MHGTGWLLGTNICDTHSVMPVSGGIAQVVQQTLWSQVAVDHQTTRWLPGGPHERLLPEPTANVFLSSVCKTLLRIQIAVRAPSSLGHSVEPRTASHGAQ